MLVLTLGATDPGMPYAPLPSHGERATLSDRLGVDLQREGYRVRRADASCEDVPCARRAGRRIGADAVVFGSTLRAMAMIWSTEATLVDVASGRARTIDAGYKGDYETMLVGMDELAPALATSLRNGVR